MSGGVDSSVAAALLKKQGFDVTGVFFKPWAPRQKFWTSRENTSKSKNLGGQATNCLWETDRLDAMRVAARLGIKFKTWDFSKEYGRQVAKYMISSYRAGITPNPDVMCNKEIKFGLFLKKALNEGADYIATGHYVRKREVKSKNLKVFKLLKGVDGNKDQSYFLWTLTQKQLKPCLFPIGGYTKPEVRRLAKKFGLHAHAKKDSQGVCFVGQLDMKQFLKNYIKPKTGEIRLADTNRLIGRHDGVFYYTIGQRHGLNIRNGEGPYFVVGKDLKKNIIWVAAGADNQRLKTAGAIIDKVNWINTMPKLPARISVKMRYRSESAPAILLSGNVANRLLIKFQKPMRAITPGQSAVFYRGEEMVGGGVIV